MKIRSYLLVVAAVLATTASVSFAEALKPAISKPGKLLLSEDFTGTALPANWQPGGRPNSFKIVNGALQGTCPPDDDHGPSIGVPIDGRNLTIQFSVKSLKPGVFLFLVDGDSQYGGQAHLLRLALHGAGAAVQQDRGTPESKREQAAAKAKAAKEGRKVPPPSAEQLADPKFYRTETLAKDSTKFLDGEWHRVMIETRGNEVVAQIDGKTTLRAQGSVLDVKKSRLVFLAGLKAEVLIDEVKVWENAPLKP